MVADDVPLVHHSPDQSRLRLQIVSGNEECRPDAVCLEGIQYGRRVAVFVTLVKGQIYHLPVRAANPVSAVPAELRGHGRRHIRLLVKRVPFQPPATPVVGKAAGYPGAGAGFFPRIFSRRLRLTVVTGSRFAITAGSCSRFRSGFRIIFFTCRCLIIRRNGRFIKPARRRLPVPIQMGLHGATEYPQKNNNNA